MFIREDGNRSYVYKKGKHGRLEKQYVEVGKNMYGSIEIVSGLTMEDEIAFPYGRNVKRVRRQRQWSHCMIIINEGVRRCLKISGWHFRNLES